jgi:hypothetical protein
LDAVIAVAPDERIEYLWPDNLDGWNAWMGVQTQWRTGMAGATGLDYSGVRAWLEVMHPKKRHRELLQGIQACERATLDVWAEQREREEMRRQAESSMPLRR